MKKKFLTMILVVCMACAMAACGKQEEASVNNGQTEDSGENKDSESGNTEQEEEKQEEKKETSDGEEWGLKYKSNIAARNTEDKKVRFYINYPTLMPHNEMDTCEVTYQKDSSLVAKFESWYKKYSIDSLETMLADGNEPVCEAMWGYYDSDLGYDTSYETSFEVDTTELTTINGFPMCKYVGNLIFDNGETKHTIPFVGYAADLQVGEGAYVMWMVFDNSEFSKLDPLEAGTIEEYALKMAESLEVIE